MKQAERADAPNPVPLIPARFEHEHDDEHDLVADPLLCTSRVPLRETEMSRWSRHSACRLTCAFASSERLTFPRALTGNLDRIWNSRGICQPLSPFRQWFSSNWRETDSAQAT
jgi:hypothetical protein